MCEDIEDGKKLEFKYLRFLLVNSGTDDVAFSMVVESVIKSLVNG